MDLWKILNPTGPDPANHCVRAHSPPSYIKPALTELGSASITDDAEAVNGCSSHDGGADTDTAMVEPASCTSPAPILRAAKSPAEVIDEVSGSSRGFNIAYAEAEGVQLGEEAEAPVPRSGALSVIAAIEKKMEIIVKSLLAEQGPFITLKTKKLSGTSSVAGDGQDVGFNQVKFLGPSQQEAWRFSKRSLMHCRNAKC